MPPQTTAKYKHEYKNGDDGIPGSGGDRGRKGDGDMVFPLQGADKYLEEPEAIGEGHKPLAANQCGPTKALHIITAPFTSVLTSQERKAAETLHSGSSSPLDDGFGGSGGSSSVHFIFNNGAVVPSGGAAPSTSTCQRGPYIPFGSPPAAIRIDVSRQMQVADGDGEGGGIFSPITSCPSPSHSTNFMSGQSDTASCANGLPGVPNLFTSTESHKHPYMRISPQRKSVTTIPLEGDGGDKIFLPRVQEVQIEGCVDLLSMPETSESGSYSPSLSAVATRSDVPTFHCLYARSMMREKEGGEEEALPQ